ncbi:MAG: HAD-IIB family hydrolase [Lachnospiraceae bacterium]|nr:HAD-IIB family hydrolase [Lachnospiraceae bacterium]
MSRKALFFDIDGTLLSEVTRQVPESAKRALEKARACGHLVFINTGRTYGQIGIIKDLVEVDGWLCGCGTYIEAGGKVLYYRVMPTEQCLRIGRAIDAADMDGIMEGKDGCYVGSPESRFEQGRDMRKHLKGSINYVNWQRECGPVEKFCVISDEQSDRAGFFRSLDLDIDVIDRGDGFYECVPAGHSKASAINVILKTYDLSLQDAYVFGDSTNDISMFEHVPNAILMGKHSVELEPFASFQTKTVEQDGIWYAMEKLGLLE